VSEHVDMAIERLMQAARAFCLSEGSTTWGPVVTDALDNLKRAARSLVRLEDQEWERESADSEIGGEG
jgi:hypothetical protein